MVETGHYIDSWSRLCSMVYGQSWEPGDYEVGVTTTTCSQPETQTAESMVLARVTPPECLLIDFSSDLLYCSSWFFERIIKFLYRSSTSLTFYVGKGISEPFLSITSYDNYGGEIRWCK